MVSEAKKRKTMLGALFGAISGAILAGGLYYFNQSLAYLFLIPVAAALGAGQIYMMTED